MELDPSDPMCYYYRALEKYASEDMDEYCEDIDRCYALIKADPAQDQLAAELRGRKSQLCDNSLPSYYYQRGIASYNLGKYSESVEFYSEGLTKFPTNSMILSFRGNSSFSLQDYKNALQDYDAAILYKENVRTEFKRNPTYSNSLNDSLDLLVNAFVSTMQISISESHFALGQYEQALIEINKGINLATDRNEIGLEIYYCVRGNIHIALGRYNTALSDFNTALKFETKCAAAYIGRAVAKTNLGNGSPPPTISVYGGLANHSFSPNWNFPFKSKLKKTDENCLDAIQDCTKALTFEPENGYAFSVRGQLKKMIQEAGYCYDLFRAQELGWHVDPSLFLDCGH
jgi:tetratricopeptide (TPR) repeat protein